MGPEDEQPVFDVRGNEAGVCSSHWLQKLPQAGCRGAGQPEFDLVVENMCLGQIGHSWMEDFTDQRAPIILKAMSSQWFGTRKQAAWNTFRNGKFIRERGFLRRFRGSYQLTSKNRVLLTRRDFFKSTGSYLPSESHEVFGSYGKYSIQEFHPGSNP